MSRYRLTCVSDNAYNIIADYEAAWCRFTAAPPHNLEEVGDAYSELMQRKKELHEYLELLEHSLGIRRSIQLRFD